MAILETLASTESMSTTISRRITDLARSIDERFEMVSMTLNGFSDSCQRIQENTPLLEEHIADLLDKILTKFENRYFFWIYFPALYSISNSYFPPPFLL